MADFVSPEKRSRIMRGSKSKDTKPEIVVRQALRTLGVSYRLHRKDLPGKPDIAFIGKKKAIFVNGCFWHQHDEPTCKIARRPESNVGFWQDKFDANKRRDVKNVAALTEGGWEVLQVWECETSDVEHLKDRLSRFLELPINHNNALAM